MRLASWPAASLVAAFAFVPAALAQVAPVSAPPVVKFDVDNENIFGFTEGTDTNEQGEKEVTLGFGARVMKRGLSDPTLPAPQTPASGGRYSALSAALGFQYGLTDDFGVEVTGFGARHVIRNVPEMGNLNRGGFDGAEVNFKYRLLERTKDNPFGLAVVAGPRWARFEEGEGIEPPRVCRRPFGLSYAAIAGWSSVA